MLSSIEKNNKVKKYLYQGFDFNSLRKTQTCVNLTKFYFLSTFDTKPMKCEAFVEVYLQIYSTQLLKHSVKGRVY